MMIAVDTIVESTCLRWSTRTGLFLVHKTNRGLCFSKTHARELTTVLDPYSKWFVFQKLDETMIWYLLENCSSILRQNFPGVLCTFVDELLAKAYTVVYIDSCYILLFIGAIFSSYIACHEWVKVYLRESIELLYRACCFRPTCPWFICLLV